MTLTRLKGRQLLIVDLDGVVWSGSHALPGAAQAIARLRAAGFRVAFLTNNSAAPPATLVAKLIGMGISCSEQEMMTSGLATALHLAGTNDQVFVIGSQALTAELQARGVRITDEHAATVVVAGLDTGFTYEKLARGGAALRRGARLVACNRDRAYPVEGGHWLPGCGPIVAALEALSGRSAATVIGKPSPAILDALLAQLRLQRGDCLVIGDSEESDIALATAAGIPSVLVASGRPHTEADAVIAAIGALPELLTSASASRGEE